MLIPDHQEDIIQPLTWTVRFSFATPVRSTKTWKLCGIQCN